MHDYALAQDIAEQVRTEARQAGARRITAVEIEVGGLSHSSAERLSFWIGEALKDGPSEEIAVRVDKVLPSLCCCACGQRSQHSPASESEWETSMPPVQCPYCDSTQVQLEGDTSCIIRRVELER